MATEDDLAAWHRQLQQVLDATAGDAPIVDLRPWWSRLLQNISTTARRASVVEALETLRLEAEAALLRATARLARSTA